MLCNAYYNFYLYCTKITFIQANCCSHYTTFLYCLFHLKRQKNQSGVGIYLFTYPWPQNELVLGKNDSVKINCLFFNKFMFSLQLYYRLFYISLSFNLMFSIKPQKYFFSTKTKVNSDETMLIPTLQLTQRKRIGPMSSMNANFYSKINAYCLKLRDLQETCIHQRQRLASFELLFSLILQLILCNN